MFSLSCSLRFTPSSLKLEVKILLLPVTLISSDCVRQFFVCAKVRQMTSDLVSIFHFTMLPSVNSLVQLARVGESVLFLLSCCTIVHVALCSLGVLDWGKQLGICAAIKTQSIVCSLRHARHVVTTFALLFLFLARVTLNRILGNLVKLTKLKNCFEAYCLSMRFFLCYQSCN